MSVLSMLGHSVVAAARMAVVLWPWALGLFVLDLVQTVAGLGHPTPMVSALVQGVSFGLGALLALRFYAGHLAVDWRAVLADRGQVGRFVLWYCFLGVLELVALPQGIVGHMPPVAVLACKLGAYYFSLRLIAILPAVVAWRVWPGVDRIWNAGGRMAMRIAALMIAVSVIGACVIAASMLLLHLDPTALSARMRHFATGNARIAPGWLVALSVVTWAIALISYAFDVACFRVVGGTEDARPPFEA